MVISRENRSARDVCGRKNVGSWEKSTTHREGSLYARSRIRMGMHIIVNGLGGSNTECEHCSSFFFSLFSFCLQNRNNCENSPRICIKYAHIYASQWITTMSSIIPPSTSKIQPPHDATLSHFRPLSTLKIPHDQPPTINIQQWQPSSHCVVLRWRTPPPPPPSTATKPQSSYLHITLDKSLTHRPMACSIAAALTDRGWQCAG